MINALGIRVRIQYNQLISVFQYPFEMLGSAGFCGVECAGKYEFSVGNYITSACIVERLIAHIIRHHPRRSDGDDDDAVADFFREAFEAIADAEGSLAVAELEIFGVGIIFVGFVKLGPLGLEFFRCIG